MTTHEAKKMLTLTEFAKLIGLGSKSSVQDAIKKGKIVQHVARENGLLRITDAEGALREWAPHFKTDDARASPKLRAKMKRIQDEMRKTLPTGEKIDRRSSQKATAEENSGIPKKAVSDAILAALKAQTAKLELDEKIGTLVKRADIDRALYAVGQEIREAFMVLPDRIVDDVLAARTRTEAHTIIMNAICATLERIAEPAAMLESKLRTS